MLAPLALAVSTALSWATAGVLVKKLSSRYGNMVAAFMVALTNVALMGTLLLIIKNFNISPSLIAISLAAGVLNAIGYLFFYKALEKQQASNTFATVEIQVVLLSAYGILVLHESIGAPKLLAIVMVIFGVFLVSYEKGHKLNKGLVPAMIANVFWALGWITLSYPINHISNSVLPVWIGFIADIAVISLVIFISEKHRRNISNIGMRGFSLGIFAGIFSATGNIIYSVLISVKQLVFGAVMANTTPAIVATFAHFAYRDRLTRLQVIGLIIVVAGGILLGFL